MLDHESQFPQNFWEWLFYPIIFGVGIVLAVSLSALQLTLDDSRIAVRRRRRSWMARHYMSVIRARNSWNTIKNNQDTTNRLIRDLRPEAILHILDTTIATVMISVFVPRYSQEDFEEARTELSKNLFSMFLKRCLPLCYGSEKCPLNDLH